MKNIEKFELAIDTENVDCVTDCWIYNRLIIIKTSPFYNDWIVSHYNLYCKSFDYEFSYGDISLTEPNYHDDILERKQLNIFKLKPENIVDKIIKYLQEGYYINIFIKSEKEERFHEVVIYGYDRITECFLAVRLENRKFDKCKLSFSHISETLPEVQNNFYSNSGKGINLAMNFQYPATLFRLKETYSNNNCAFEAYKKLRREILGNDITISTVTGFSKSNFTYKYYTGIGCLNMLYLLVQQVLEGTNEELTAHKVVRAVKKLTEHRKIIIKTMKYVYDKWKICMDKKVLECIEKYESCYKQVEKWLVLAMRYEQTKNKNCLNIILNEITDLYARERSILNEFVFNSIDWNKFNENFI